MIPGLTAAIEFLSGTNSGREYMVHTKMNVAVSTPFMLHTSATERSPNPTLMPILLITVSSL